MLTCVAVGRLPGTMLRTSRPIEAANGMRGVCLHVLLRQLEVSIAPTHVSCEYLHGELVYLCIIQFSMLASLVLPHSFSSHFSVTEKFTPLKVQ